MIETPPPPESGELVATLRGHEASVKSLSLHSSGRFVLAVSSRDSVLWDLDSFARCRTLNGGQEVGVQEVRGPVHVAVETDSHLSATISLLDSFHAVRVAVIFSPCPWQVLFQPMSNTILTCFKDDSIHAWEAASMEYKYQIQPPFGPAPHYRYIAL